MFLNGYEWSEGIMKKEITQQHLRKSGKCCNCQLIGQVGLALGRNSLPIGCKLCTTLKENTQSFMPLLALFVQLLLKKCEHQMCCLKVFKTLLVKA